MNHPNQHHSQQQQRHEPPCLLLYSQTQARNYTSSTNLTQSHQHVLPQSNIPLKRSLETSPSPPSTYQPLVYNTNTNPSFNTNTSFEHSQGSWYPERILPAPVPTRAPGQWQWQGQGQGQGQTEGQSRTWNNTSNKTYAHRFKRRVAVFQDAEYPETETKTGNVSVKKSVKRLLSPFESDPERTQSEMKTDSESTTDSEATEIEDNEMLLLPEYKDPVEMLIEDFKSNPKSNPKTNRQSQSKHQPQPRPQLPNPRVLGWQTTETHAPLSNDAISNILLQCRPQSPKAKTWIAENEAKKVANARMKAANSGSNLSVNERDGLRRRVLQLRPKNEWNIWQNRGRVAGADGEDGYGMKMAMDMEVESSRLFKKGNGISGLSPGRPESERQYRGEVKARPLPSIPDQEFEPESVGIPMTMNRGGNAGPAHSLNETDKRIYGAMKASSRLQYLVCDHENPADMSLRVKRELQNVFVMPRERQY